MNNIFAVVFSMLAMMSFAMGSQAGEVGGSTSSSDFAFEPKVWSDHIQGYFDRILVFGQFALRDNTLEAEGTGLQVNFPYFKTVGDAEEPAEDEALTVDKLQDDSFFAVVFEVGKAIGFKKKVFKKSAASQDKIMAEAQRQIGRVHAEKVDKKLVAEIQTSGTTGYQATDAAHTMNIRTLNTGKTVAFGDKADDSQVCFMHSLQMLDLQNDTTAGFMQANANDPFMMVKGFKGRLLNMAIVVNDNVPQLAAVGGKKQFQAIVCKENAYGIMRKQEMEMDSDKDILTREVIVVGNEWYAVKNFDKKVSSADKKIAFINTTTNN